MKKLLEGNVYFLFLAHCGAQYRDYADKLLTKHWFTSN